MATMQFQKPMSPAVIVHGIMKSPEGYWTVQVMVATSEGPFPDTTLVTVRVRTDANTGRATSFGAYLDPEQSTNIIQSDFWALPGILGLVEMASRNVWTSLPITLMNLELYK